MICPAQAGVIPSYQKYSEAVHDLSRASGGDPGLAQLSILEK